MNQQDFERIFNKPKDFYYSDSLGCYCQDMSQDWWEYKDSAIGDFNNKWYGWLAAMQFNEADKE